MSTATETRNFEAETKQLLDLMIHSLYTNKEIFLRELISNASDALDKLRFSALTEPGLMPEGEELEIRLDVDADARTLTIHDNGIGMSRQEVIDNIGSIARSGTQEMLKKLGSQKGAEKMPELIGRFGCRLLLGASHGFPTKSCLIPAGLAKRPRQRGAPKATARTRCRTATAAVRGQA